MSRALRLALAAWLTGALGAPAIAAERPTFRDSRPTPAVTVSLHAPSPSSAPLTADVPEPAPTASPLVGVASWYCLPRVSPCTAHYGPSGAYAAAGPALRRNKGWRGSYVVVRHGDVAVRVRLIDWCECPGGRLLDLYSSVVKRLGLPLSGGIYQVTVEW